MSVRDDDPIVAAILAQSTVADFVGAIIRLLLEKGMITREELRRAVIENTAETESRMRERRR